MDGIGPTKVAATDSEHCTSGSVRSGVWTHYHTAATPATTPTIIPTPLHYRYVHCNAHRFRYTGRHRAMRVGGDLWPTAGRALARHPPLGLGRGATA